MKKEEVERLNIKGNTQISHIAFQDRVVFVNDLARGRFFFHGLYRNRSAMFITTA